jgi:ketosteroid isomerase-like protein
MIESTNVRTTRALIGAMNDGDFEAVNSMVTEDIVVLQPFAAMGMPERMEGRDAFMAGVSFVPHMFRLFKLTISEVYDCPDDDVVVFEQTSHGVFHVDGSEFGNRYIMKFAFRAGKVCLWQEVYDSRIMTEKITPIMAKMAKMDG